MPLRAKVDGQDVIAPFLSDEEWGNLQARVRNREAVLVMPCCEHPGYLRRSKLGTKHFVHKAEAQCHWKPETPEHVLAKTIIALACREAGYEVLTEATGPGYEADVLAEKGVFRFAFEVQLSYQTLEKTLERREKFAADEVKDYWLFAKPPATRDSGKKHKRFHLLKREGDDFFVQYPKSRKLLGSFVRQVLRNAEREPVERYDYVEPVGNEYVINPFAELFKVALLAGICAAVIGVLHALFSYKRK